MLRDTCYTRCSSSFEACLVYTVGSMVLRDVIAGRLNIGRMPALEYMLVVAEYKSYISSSVVTMCQL